MTHEELKEAHSKFRSQIREAIVMIEDYEDECDQVWTRLHWWDAQKLRGNTVFLVSNTPSKENNVYSDMRPVPSNEGIVPNLVSCLNSKSQKWELFSTANTFIPSPF